MGFTLLLIALLGAYWLGYRHGSDRPVKVTVKRGRR